HHLGGRPCSLRNRDENHGSAAQQRRHPPGSAGGSARWRGNRETVSHERQSSMSSLKRKPSSRVSHLTQEQREERKAFSLAVGIHALLFAFMLVGFVSSPTTPQPVQVELWTDGVSPNAQPEEPIEEEETAVEPDPVPEPEPEPTPEPEPEPTPEPEPLPEPEPAPEPEPVAPPPVPEAEPEPDPEIALEEARKRK